MSVIPVHFEINEVGKTFKRYCRHPPTKENILSNMVMYSTKKQYLWKFKLDGKDFAIEMFNSSLSGKKKILQNGQVIYFDSK